MAESYSAEKFLMSKLLNVMQDGKAGVIDCFFPFFPYSYTIINILGRVEYLFIKAADFFKQFAAEKPTGGNRIIDIGYL